MYVTFNIYVINNQEIFLKKLFYICNGYIIHSYIYTIYNINSLLPLFKYKIILN